MNPPLTPAQRTAWNKFVDYVAAQKMTNHPSLDQRDKSVGLGLLQQYNKANPDAALAPELIPQVQQDLQDYRTEMLGRIKAGKAAFDGKPEEFMSNLSAVDGWPGTKTLSSRFPSWATQTTTPTGTTTANNGTNYADYDKQLLGAMNRR